MGYYYEDDPHMWDDDPYWEDEDPEYNETREELAYFVDEGFKVLRKQDVTCLANFLCCTSCGFAAWEPEDVGDCLVFYHEQDLDTANRGYMYLAYDAYRTERGKFELGHKIIRAMESVGLKTEWDGSTSQKIKVKLDYL